MSEHTPGPWYIDPLKIRANGNLRIMAEQCTPVAVVPEDMRANARLIASAPDLLEALQVIASQSLGEDWTADQAVAFIKEHAKAAIAKAKGEKP